MHPAAFSILFFLPLALGLSNLSISSSNPTSGGSVTITWTPVSSDPSVFSLVLGNTGFHDTFAIANNVQTSSGQITVTLPIVPADEYTLEAVQIDDINQVIGTSAPIPIGATVTTTSSASTSSALSSSGSVSSPTGSSASTTGSASSLLRNSATSSSSSSSSSSSASASSFNGNGALGTHVGSGNVGSMAVAIVGIVAGAVFV